MKAWMAYILGYKCGLNGPNETNCHYSLFGTPELTQAWERGKADAEAGRKPDPEQA